MTFSLTKSLVLSDFEQFSARSDFDNEAIIGKPLLGKSRFKAITLLSLQRLSGETASIVNDFKKTLTKKYGEEIAAFVFSQQHEQAALSQGLNKKTIAAVFKKAAALEETHFLSYRKALQTKHEVVIKVVKKLKGRSCYKEAQKKCQAIQKQLQEFDGALAGVKLDQHPFANLQDYFEKKLIYVDLLTRHIITLPEAEEKIEKIFGKSEQSQEMLTIFLQHEEVMEELKQEFNETSRSSTSGAVMAEVGKSLDPLVRTIEKAAATLSSFSNHFHEENSSNYFSLNQRGEVIIEDQVAKGISGKRAQEHAATIFFDALKKCYGVDFIHELWSEEDQRHPITVGEAVELFKKIHESFEKLAVFFQKQPLLITKEYIDALCDHPHLARQVEGDNQQLKPRESSLVQSMRRMIGTSILGAGHYAASSSYSLIAGAHVSHLAVLGAVSGSLGVAALIGAAVGAPLLTGYGRRAQVQAAGVSAIFTMEGTLGEIAATMVSPIFPDGGIAFNHIRDFLRSSLISWGIGFGIDATAVVNAACNGFIGGSVSGALFAGTGAQRAPVSANTTSFPRARADHEEINIEDEVNLDVRLGFNGALELAKNNLLMLVQALSRIPIDEANRESVPTRSMNL